MNSKKWNKSLLEAWLKAPFVDLKDSCVLFENLCRIWNFPLTCHRFSCKNQTFLFEYSSIRLKIKNQKVLFQYSSVRFSCKKSKSFVQIFFNPVKNKITCWLTLLTVCISQVWVDQLMQKIERLRIPHVDGDGRSEITVEIACHNGSQILGRLQFRLNLLRTETYHDHRESEDRFYRHVQADVLEGADFLRVSRWKSSNI